MTEIASQEDKFITDDVKDVIEESIENTLGTNRYDPANVNLWASQIVEKCLDRLAKNGKAYKYVVTSMIMQKNGTGLHTASSCYWNDATDGISTVRWENKAMHCLVSVYGLAV